MADDITIPTTGAGTATPVVATEEVASKHYQKIKLIDPTTASSSPIGVTANPLHIQGAQIGGLTETAPATDTASSGLNGRLQRIAQRLSTLITNLGSPLQADGNITTVTTVSNVTDLAAKIGEVQASPTANTVLDRLKALLTGIVLSAGTAIIGKVGIDQTTPGTTNAVQANAGTNLNTSTLALEAGGNLAAASTTLGAVADAAVSTDTTGSLSAKIRGLIKILTTLSQSLYVLPGTAISFKNTAGDITMTMKNIATAAGRISDQQDRGAGAIPGWYEWKATMEAAANITIGNAFRIYIFNSNTTGADTTTDTALTAETQLNNFQLLGSVYASATAVGPFYNRGYVFIPGRYVNLGWWNASGQTTANTDGTCAITLTPMPPNFRPWS